MQTIAERPPLRSLAWQIAQACFIGLSFLLFLYQYYHYGWVYDRAPLFFFPLTAMFAGVSLARYGLLRRWDIRLAAGLLVWIFSITWINYRSIYFGYDRTLYRVLFYALVCYPLALVVPSAARRRVVHGLLHAFCLVVTCLSLWGIVHVLSGTQGAPYGPGGFVLGLQQDYDLRLSLYMHPNYAGALCCFAMLVSVYLLLSHRHTAVRVYCLVCALITFVAMALADSRSSMLGAAVALGMLAFLAVQKALALKKPLLRWAVALLALALCAIVCYLGFGLVADGVHGMAARAEDVATDRSLVGALGSGNGRYDIWRAAFAAIGENPAILLKGTLFEHSLETVLPYLTTTDPYAHLHNAFIQTLVSIGLPGLLLLLAWLGLILWQGARLFLCSRAAIASRFLPAILIAGLCNAMLESMLFLSDQWIFDGIFFLIAGLVVALAGEALPSAKADAGKAS